MTTTEDIMRFPIGKYASPTEFTNEIRADFISTLRALPLNLRLAVHKLGDEQLDTPYRDGGWTIRQVVHHVADSHINAYVRFRLALTEDNPTIKPYEESLWAELSDAKSGDVQTSLMLIEALHNRWCSLLESLTEQDWKRTFHHPVSQRNSTIENALGMYAWHSRHHTAHITECRKRNNW